MDLDRLDGMQALDTEGMYAYIDQLPEQLRQAWELGLRLPLQKMEDIRQVVIAGMGGSAIGGDLVMACGAENLRVPVVLHRNYGLPGWARGPETLVICSSHSGQTEETLEAFEAARAAGCRILTLSTGGALQARAAEAGLPSWTFEHAGQPRSAVGFSFGLLLAAFFRLGLLPDPDAELTAAVSDMQAQRESLRMETPTHQNPAKRMAGQLVGRIPVILGADALAPVARRWKGQASELAKAWGQFEELPEADHNTLAGLLNPEEALSRLAVVFLQGESVHPRNQKRLQLTRQMMTAEGLFTDSYQALGAGKLAQQWTALQFGDYTMFYLAAAYGMDPTPVEALVHLKAVMKTSR